MIATRPAAECEYDLVALGEVMLRLDPGEGRIRTARRFAAWEGGGEYNVARGLRRCFGLRAAVVTALADNEVGRLVEDLILQGGVDTSLIRWEPYDGIGRTVRNGLNFTERGFGVRGAVGVSDRGHTAVASSRPATSTGTTCSASAGCAGCTPAASSPRCPRRRRRRRGGDGGRPAARHRRLLRPQLPAQPVGRHRRPGARPGGQPRLAEPRRRDVRQRGGLHGRARLRGRARRRAPQRRCPMDSFEAMVGKVAEKYRGFQVIATTLRTVHTASDNDWRRSPGRRRPASVVARPRPPRDPRPGRRRRQLRLRPDLRAAARARRSSSASSTARPTAPWP